MKKQPSGFGVKSILILIAVIALIWAYYHFRKVEVKSVENKIATTTPAYKEENPYIKTESEHVYPEKMVVTGTDQYAPDGTFTKDVVLPKFRNIEDKNVLAKLNTLFSFEKAVGDTAEDMKLSFNGTTDATYNINYDKNGILSISYMTEFMGPYPSEYTNTSNINLKTGDEIKLSDIFYPEKIKLLVGFLDAKLQDSIRESEALGHKNNPEKTEGECTGDEFKTWAHEGGASYGHYTEKSLEFVITDKGLEFPYEFDFPHVIQACEPSQIGVVSYADLKEYMRADGLLTAEIK